MRNFLITKIRSIITGVLYKPEPAAVVQTAPQIDLKRFVVRNNGEAATIYIEQGKRKSGDIENVNNWGEITINSSFGCYGHYFGHLGSRTFKDFLTNCEPSYLIYKLSGRAGEVFDAKATVKELTKLLLEHRKTGEVSREDARQAYDAVLDQRMQDDANLFWMRLHEELPESFTVDDLELYRLEQAKVAPQIDGFFRELWPQFIEQLKTPGESQ